MTIASALLGAGYFRASLIFTPTSLKSYRYYLRHVSSSWLVALYYER